MEIMYWRFPHLNGEWGVKAGCSSILVNGASELGVKWVNGVPFDGNIRGVLCARPTSPPPPPTKSVWDTQVGGNHYTKMKSQPFPFSMENDLDPMQHTSPKSAWDTQVGGNHYTKMKIQPFQFSMANDLDPMQHTIIKYVTRFRDKNGIEDLEKAKQTIDLLIAYEKEQKNATN